MSKIIEAGTIFFFLTTIGLTGAKVVNLMYEHKLIHNVEEFDQIWLANIICYFVLYTLTVLSEDSK